MTKLMILGKEEE